MLQNSMKILLGIEYAWLFEYQYFVLFSILYVFCMHFADAQCPVAHGQLIQTCTTEM